MEFFNLFHQSKQELAILQKMSTIVHISRSFKFSFLQQQSSTIPSRDIQKTDHKINLIHQQSKIRIIIKKLKTCCLLLWEVNFYTEAAPDARQIQCMSMELIQLCHPKIGKKPNLLQLNFAGADHQGSLKSGGNIQLIHMILDSKQQ